MSTMTVIIDSCEEENGEFDNSDTIDAKSEYDYEMPFTCGQCGKVFFDSDTLTKHRLSHIYGKRFKCKHCGASFNSPINVTSHRQVREERLYHCKKCGDTFATACDAISHRRTHAAEEPEVDVYGQHQCQECGKLFPKPSALARHKIMHLDEKMFSCNECPKTFKFKGSLQAHQRDHRGVKPYKCALCEEAFKRRDALERHHRRTHVVKTRVDKKLYECSLCGKSFKRESNLRFHINAHKRKIQEKPVDKSYLCSMCGKSFNRKANRDRHEKVHARQLREALEAGETGVFERPYKCSVCEKAFRNEDFLERHERTHIEESLEQCGILFSHSERKTDEKQHKYDKAILGSGKKPVNKQVVDELYQCSMCLRSFSCKANRDRHERSHGLQFRKAGGIGVVKRLYKCSLRGKAFRNEDFLECHERTHADESDKDYDTSPSHSKNQTEHRCDEIMFISGTKPFVCSVCGLKFEEANSVLQHRRKYHSNESPYQCFKCGEAFEYLADAVFHRPTHADVTCKSCAKVFQTYSDLVRHQRTHLWPYQCLQCGKRFKFMGDLYSHEKNHSKRRLKDKGVGKPSSSSFTRYQRPHTGTELYKCIDCDKTFTQAVILRFHQRSHVDEKKVLQSERSSSFKVPKAIIFQPRIRNNEIQFPCEDCSETFAQENALVKHRRTHVDDMLYQSQYNIEGLGVSVVALDKSHECLECGRSFSDSRSLSRHERLHTDEKPYTCDVCGKQYIQAVSLKYHMRTHTGERPYKCNGCDKSFIVSDALKKHRKLCDKAFETDKDEVDNTTFGLVNHRRTHTEEKPFKCKKCSKLFWDSNKLKKHERVHSNKKPYKCFECGKAFRNNAYLISHRRTHTGEKPFKCKECCRFFSTSKSLTRHERIHTGEKPFKCELCGKGYIQTSSLHYHMRTHTGERPYNCNDCALSFITSYSLKSHQKTCKKAFKTNSKGAYDSSSGDTSSVTYQRQGRTENKWYQGLKCKKSFQSSIALKQNMLSHADEMMFNYKESDFSSEKAKVVAPKHVVRTEIKPYQCTQCSKSFQLAIAMKIHLRSHI